MPKPIKVMVVDGGGGQSPRNIGTPENIKVRSKSLKTSIISEFPRNFFIPHIPNRRQLQHTQNVVRALYRELNDPVTANQQYEVIIVSSRGPFNGDFDKETAYFSSVMKHEKPDLVISTSADVEIDNQKDVHDLKESLQISLAKASEDNKVLFLQAAGNEYRKIVEPASVLQHDTSVSVESTGDYSNREATGQQSTITTKPQLGSGTSFSTPKVAGIILKGYASASPEVRNSLGARKMFLRYKEQIFDHHKAFQANPKDHKKDDRDILLKLLKNSNETERLILKEEEKRKEKALQDIISGVELNNLNFNVFSNIKQQQSLAR